MTTSSSLHFGSVRDVLRWATTIPLLFTFMLASSMLALDLASMGAIVVVRNVAPIITLAMERAVSEHIELDAPTILSMLVIIGGVVLYTFNDIQFSAAGLAAWSKCPLGSAPARLLLCLLRARLVAQGGVHSQEEAGPQGAQPLPRVLELAASKAADFPAFDHLGLALMAFNMISSVVERVLQRETNPNYNPNPDPDPKP